MCGFATAAECSAEKNLRLRPAEENVIGTAAQLGRQAKEAEKYYEHAVKPGRSDPVPDNKRSPAAIAKPNHEAGCVDALENLFWPKNRSPGREGAGVRDLSRVRHMPSLSGSKGQCFGPNVKVDASICLILKHLELTRAKCRGKMVLVEYGSATGAQPQTYQNNPKVRAWPET
jgi:hypothetical protein